MKVVNFNKILKKERAITLITVKSQFDTEGKKLQLYQSIFHFTKKNKESNLMVSYLFCLNFHQGSVCIISPQNRKRDSEEDKAKIPRCALFKRF